MSRWRTHNNRRRAKMLKQGGLYTLRRGYWSGAALRWGDNDSLVLPSWYEAMRAPHNPEDDFAWR